jgi:alginate O-acetyltransferase complex protein AlgI
MVFSSTLFLLLFLPVFLLVYYLIPYKLKNAWALLASAAFYAWGAPVFVFVLFGSILFDFVVVRQFTRTKHPKGWMLLAVVVNVALLGYFKYANFFVENTNALLSSLGAGSVSWTAVVLPIGISFFTFQKISYIVDVYRGIRAPLQRFSDHALYVILFPQLIAGPIVRYNEIAEEITDRKAAITADNRLLGFFRFSIGLGKKVIIANVLGEQADLVFNGNIAGMNAATAWYGALCYTFQIYFDFSGYSDMAIGLGRMMGFTFPENFNNPYVAQSITEFWRRWHITLSNWMRDYLYIPLGGNRVSTKRLYLNLWLVFLISGLWHGAAWTFVIWGAYHGLFLVLERMFLLKWYQYLPKLVRVLLTFLLAMVGWVFFRANYLNEATTFLGTMFSFKGWELNVSSEVLNTLVLATGICAMALFTKVEAWQMRVYETPPSAIKSALLSLSAAVLLIVSMKFIASTDFNPFIYFRF